MAEWYRSMAPLILYYPKSTHSSHYMHLPSYYLFSTIYFTEWHTILHRLIDTLLYCQLVCPLHYAHTYYIPRHRHNHSPRPFSSHLISFSHLSATTHPSQLLSHPLFYPLSITLSHLPSQVLRTPYPPHPPSHHPIPPSPPPQLTTVCSTLQHPPLPAIPTPNRQRVMSPNINTNTNPAAHQSIENRIATLSTRLLTWWDKGQGRGVMVIHVERRVDGRRECCCCMYDATLVRGWDGMVSTWLGCVCSVLNRGGYGMNCDWDWWRNVPFLCYIECTRVTGLC